MEVVEDTKDEDLMRAVQYVSGGDADKMHIGAVSKPEVREKEVLIKVFTTAVNRGDILQRKGKYDPPKGESKIIGLEVAGFVEKLGPGCSRWKEGDRVMALICGGGYAEYVSAPEDHVMSVPKTFTLDQAGGIPEAWLTAYQLIYKVAGVKKGDSVLIHAGGSGVGLAAVQLVKLCGGFPIVTSGTPEKLAKARELGAVAGYNYKTENFSKEVLNYTDGKGVQIILDCVGASMVEQNAAAIAVDGCWVLYGTLGGTTISFDLLKNVLFKRIRLQGTTLRNRSKEYKSQLIKDFSKDILPHLEQQELQPVIDCIFPLGQISKAHQYVENNKNIGKVIIKVQAEDIAQDE